MRGGVPKYHQQRKKRFRGKAHKTRGEGDFIKKPHWAEADMCLRAACEKALDEPLIGREIRLNPGAAIKKSTTFQIGKPTTRRRKLKSRFAREGT